MRSDREEVLSAKLQRELDEAKKQIEHLQRPETPTSGIPYAGYVQAREDVWDGKQIWFGPNSPYTKRPGRGDVFYIEMPDYWPGCPFTPVIVTGRDPTTGQEIVAPHPDFQSH